MTALEFFSSHFHHTGPAYCSMKMDKFLAPRLGCRRRQLPHCWHRRHLQCEDLRWRCRKVSRQSEQPSRQVIHSPRPTLWQEGRGALVRNSEKWAGRPQPQQAWRQSRQQGCSAIDVPEGDSGGLFDRGRIYSQFKRNLRLIDMRMFFSQFTVRLIYIPFTLDWYTVYWNMLLIYLFFDGTHDHSNTS